MSLVRLLAAGKSLVGLRDGASPYRVTRQRLLPAFGTRPNPFRDTQSLTVTPGGEPPAVTVASTLAAAEAEPRLGALPAVAGLAEPEPSAVATQAPPVSSVTRLRLKLTGLFTRKGAPSASTLPRLTQQVVQGELALDRVKVMRNDLRDADLEVVPRRAAAPEAAPLVRESRPPAGPVTVRVETSRMPLRLFGAGKA